MAKVATATFALIAQSTLPVLKTALSATPGGQTPLPPPLAVHLSAWLQLFPPLPPLAFQVQVIAWEGRDEKQANSTLSAAIGVRHLRSHTKPSASGQASSFATFMLPGLTDHCLSPVSLDERDPATSVQRSTRPFESNWQWRPAWFGSGNRQIPADA